MHIEGATRSFRFFLEAVDRTWHQLGLKEDPKIERYLAELLEQFSPDHQTKIAKEGLLIKLREYVFRRKPLAETENIRGIADASLLAAGFLGPYLVRHSQLGVKFYVDVGERAYALLAERVPMSDMNYSVFRVFGSDLAPYVSVLAEIRASYLWRANIDEVLRMCRKHLARDNEQSRQWFEEHSIMLLPEIAEDLKKIIITDL
ncbi:MAG: hypothetical protein Q7S09_04110 [bacterium]|nr:hypothetical protein [bacterium]